MRKFLWNRSFRRGVLASVLVAVVCASAFSQKKHKTSPAPAQKPPAEETQSELAKLRDEYVKTDHPPASTLVEVSRLFREDVLIEIDAVAIAE